MKSLNKLKFIQHLLILSWPSFALVSICSFNNCRDICGGTLIDATTVLTAAHCLQFPGYTYTVYLGLQQITLKNAAGVVKLNATAIYVTY